ncbi:MULTISPECIES: DUF4352 domain-containing protein [Brachybacterium]|uniref:DUF4352 domain-containing protein n=2 Tax=Brachybacterium TaxID=43668 RepID=A0A426SL77_9MICO|nr:MULTISPECIES: DUF4352 domain-containing protein [Brachybacterium]RRR18890.1 hypothetical protein DS079_08905 [Brachybacterium paraconglomeratum]GLI30772.1 hypothetical protein BCONGLO52_16130 [Brachybacterium conglomeratum]GLK05286.1 hypothetical protein GCM10017597_20860 [Brachybacterium conglomeratum]
MHTDREASEQDGRPALPTDPAPAEPAGTPELPAPQGPVDASHEYGYGNDEELPAPGGVEPAEPTQQTEGPDDLSETERRSVTGVQGVTAPRAMLRPVPEGFPTPPPRPAVPNRRPAKVQDPDEAKGSRRGLLIGAIVLVAALVLAVAVGGGILAFRALGSDDPGDSDPAAPAGTAAPQDGASGGSATIGEIEMTTVSTEAGVRSVGSRSNPVEPEGEFVIATVEIDNQGDRAAPLTPESISLESADGATHPLDLDASRVHIADSKRPTQIPGGGSGTVHLVFDVPIGTEPSAILVDFGEDMAGSLPLAG